MNKKLKIGIVGSVSISLLTIGLVYAALLTTWSIPMQMKALNSMKIFEVDGVSEAHNHNWGNFVANQTKSWIIIIKSVHSENLYVAWSAPNFPAGWSLNATIGSGEPWAENTRHFSPIHAGEQTTAQFNLQLTGEISGEFAFTLDIISYDSYAG